MPMALRHGALPETLAVAQGAVLMPLETLVVHIADCKLRSLPITFKYAGAAALMLLGATVLYCAAWRAGRRARWCLSRGFYRRPRARDCCSARTRHRKTIGLLSALFARAVLAAS